MTGLGSRTTAPQQIVYDALKAADTGDSKAFVALNELVARCVAAEEALRTIAGKHAPPNMPWTTSRGWRAELAKETLAALAAVPEENQP